MPPRPNVRLSELTNVLLKPERSRFTIEDGLAVLLCCAVLAIVVTAIVAWG